MAYKAETARRAKGSLTQREVVPGNETPHPRVQADVTWQAIEETKLLLKLGKVEAAKKRLKKAERLHAASKVAQREASSKRGTRGPRDQAVP